MHRYWGGVHPTPLGAPLQPTQPQPHTADMAHYAFQSSREHIHSQLHSFRNDTDSLNYTKRAWEDAASYFWQLKKETNQTNICQMYLITAGKNPYTALSSSFIAKMNY